MDLLEKKITRSTTLKIESISIKESLEVKNWKKHTGKKKKASD